MPHNDETDEVELVDAWRYDMKWSELRIHVECMYRRRRELSRGRSLGRPRCLRAARARAARPELERLRPGSAARAKPLMLRI